MKSKHQQSACVTGNSRLLSCINVSLGSVAPVLSLFTAGTFQKQKPHQPQDACVKEVMMWGSREQT